MISIRRIAAASLIGFVLLLILVSYTTGRI